MQVPEVLKNIAKDLSLKRDWYSEDKMPTSMSNVCIVCVFGDVRNVCISSMILIKRIREEIKGSKYFIVLSWPGMGSLFPYADEFWSVSEKIMESSFYHSSGMINESPAIQTTIRELGWKFEDVLDHKDLIVFYNNGIQDDYLKRFRHIKRFKPSISSASVLGGVFNRELTKRVGSKVLISPVKQMEKWRMGKKENFLVPKEFWVNLTNFLLSKGILPVIWLNPNTYDLSVDFANECLYLNTTDIGNITSAMRAIGCVVDIFQGISRYALIARSPFVVCDERVRYNSCKEYEIDDLCGQNIQHDYFYSFPSIIESGDVTMWKSSIFDVLFFKLNNLLTQLDNNTWPSTAETYDIVPLNNVRRIKNNKLGVRFIRVPKI